MENLKELFKEKWFDRYQNGLEARFSADKMEYEYAYEESNSIRSLLVLLSVKEVKTKIIFTDQGTLTFKYSANETNKMESFRGCSQEDFHTMLAYAFIYIRDGNFDYHKDWYESLVKAS